MQNFVKIGKRFLRYRDISIFKMAAILDFEILTFWFPDRFGGLRCNIVPNFIKIDRTAAEILHLTFFKMAAVRHLGFVKNSFLEHFLMVRRANVHQHAKFRRNRSNHC